MQNSIRHAISSKELSNLPHLKHYVYRLFGIALPHIKHEADTKREKFKQQFDTDTHGLVTNYPNTG